MTEVEQSGERPWNADIDCWGGIGSAALHTLSRTWWAVSKPSEGHRHWLANDYRVLNATFHLEGYIAARGLPSEAPPDVRLELNRCLGLWHSALPFSEAERGLILDADRSPEREAIEPGPEKVRGTARIVRKTELELIDSGVRKMVKGRELMRRWWLWRREMGDYADQGGLTQAKDALRDFVGLLIPAENMPGIYYDLQGQERPVPYRDDLLAGR